MHNDGNEIIYSLNSLEKEKKHKKNLSLSRLYTKLMTDEGANKEKADHL